jgi:4-amino-4-deoxy-L-arabinose transferase-like glycosyltransferase
MTAASVVAAATTGRRPAPASLIAAAGLASALVVAFLIWPVQELVDRRPDPYNYAAIASQMVRDGFAAHGLTKREASLYPVAIAAVYRSVGESPLVIVLGQCLLFAATCALAFDLGRRLYNRRTALIAGLLVALNPLLLRYVGDLHMETMLTFLVTANVWTMVRFHERPTVLTGALVGLSAAVAGLTKGVALVPPLVFGVSWVLRGLVAGIRGIRPPAPWAAVAAIALTTIAIITPWTIRNYRVTGGRFVLLAPGFNDAFLRGYVFSRPEYALLQRSPYVDAENECNAWLREICLRGGSEFGRDEVRDEQILGAEARRMIAEQPLATVRKISVGIFTFWYQMTGRLTSVVAGVSAATAWLLTLSSRRRVRAEGIPSWLLWAPIVSMNLAIATLCSLGRYSMPIVPCLMVMAAFGVDTLLRRGSRVEAVRIGLHD